MGLHYQAGPAVLDLSSLDQRDWLALQDCQMGLVGKNLVTLPPLPTLHVPYEMFKVFRMQGTVRGTLGSYFSLEGSIVAFQYFI